MKSILYILMFLTSYSFTGSSQQHPKAEYTHNFPEVIKGNVKTEFVKLFEKGKVLYQINCAKCHNSIIDGVETMRQFTNEDLAKYEMRLMNPEHEEELSSTKIRPEELYQITLFLQYSIRVNKDKIENKLKKEDKSRSKVSGIPKI